MFPELSDQLTSPLLYLRTQQLETSSTVYHQPLLLLAVDLIGQQGWQLTGDCPLVLVDQMARVVLVLRRAYWGVLGGWDYGGSVLRGYWWGLFLVFFCFISWFVALGLVILGLGAAMLGYLRWWGIRIAVRWVSPCYFNLRFSDLDPLQP